MMQRYLFQCPNCGKDILRQGFQCAVPTNRMQQADMQSDAEFTLEPSDPEKHKVIRLFHHIPP